MMDRRMGQALDRYITGNYGEDNVKDESPGIKRNTERGHKPIEQNIHKCSYNNCDNKAVSYSYGGSYGLFLCKKHGGKKVDKEENY